MENANAVQQAKDAAKAARMALEDARIDHAAGVIDTDELEAADLRVRVATANIAKAELATKREQEQKLAEIKERRFELARERAKEVRIDAIDMLTDNLRVARDIAGGIANQMARQVAFLETVYRSMRISATATFGQERAFDVRNTQGEGRDDPANLLNRAEDVANQIRDAEALGIAAEEKYYAVQDEAVAKNEIPETQMRNCFYRTVGGTRFEHAVEHARRQRDEDWAKKRAKQQAEREQAVEQLTPFIDAELITG